MTTQEIIEAYVAKNGPEPLHAAPCSALLHGNATGHGWVNILRADADGNLFYGHCHKSWSADEMAMACNEPRSREDAIERGWKPSYLDDPKHWYSLKPNEPSSGAPQF